MAAESVCRGRRRHERDRPAPGRPAGSAQSVPVAAQGVACVAVLTPPRSRSEGSLEHRLV